MMINSVRRVFSLLMLAAVAQVSQAQTAGGADAGYTVEVDDAFTYTSSSGFDIFRSEDGKSAVFIMNWPGLKLEDVDRYMTDGYQDARLALVADGEPVEVTLENGSGRVVDVEGILERRKVDGLAGGFIGDNGQGFVIMQLTAADAAPGFDEAVKQVSASIRFTPADQAADKGFDAEDWRYVLGGARLALRDENDGRMIREDYSFCRNGRFHYRQVRQQSLHDDASSAFGMSSEARSGRWRVIDDNGQSRLQLRDRHGETRDIQLEDREGKTYLDGKRYYLLQNRRCR